MMAVPVFFRSSVKSRRIWAWMVTSRAVVEISMIFQEPMTSLNPVFTVGRQIMESLIYHQSCPKAEAKAKAVEMLRLVDRRDHPLLGVKVGLEVFDLQDRIRHGLPSFNRSLAWGPGRPAIDILLAFPSLLLAITVVAILGNGTQNTAIAIAIFSIPSIARMVRGIPCAAESAGRWFQS